MELNLKEKVAIVTGGSKGIGKSIAKSLAIEGANVIICARGKESLCAAEKEIADAGGHVFAISVDAANPESVQNVIDKTIDRYGKLDVLINNIGGVNKFGGFFELKPEDWKLAFDLNVMTMVYFVERAYPWLCRSVAPRIINISSISGLQPGSYNPHYTITKAAVINLSKCLSNLFMKDKILVNVVCPGPVHSDSWDKNVQHIAKLKDISLEAAKISIDIEESAKIPIGRIGEGDDIAGLVAFLVSDKASWITGSCFHINGGKLHTIS
ncbi:MAG: SDR family oxidoreductase [Nitrospirae bacterium]|nr:SDR family oxidoreductase [Nitrospirota bacterium]